MAIRYKYDGEVPYDRHRFDTSDISKMPSEKQAAKAMKKNLKRINELQQKLYAEKKEGVIFLFQAMDAAGKDGTIRTVLSCLSPHGVTEAAFKAPSSDELLHDFLWRVQRYTPARGQIAIFNRSHYEDVLIGKVHRLYLKQPHADYVDPDKIIETRYKDICNWEKYLYNNNIRVVKIFLNVGRPEQARRFLSRIREEKKNWKFSESDVQERAFWDDYQKAIEDAINETATNECPWYVVPADHKWYMRWLVSQIIRDTLEKMDLHWPEASAESRALFARYEAQLAAEAGPDPENPEETPKKEKPAKKEKAPKEKKEKPAKTKEEKPVKKEKADKKEAPAKTKSKKKTQKENNLPETAPAVPAES